MRYFRSFCLRPVAITALILSWVSTTTLAFAAPTPSVDMNSVVVQRVDLNSGKTEYFALNAADLLDEKGAVKVPREKFDAVVTQGKSLPKDQIQQWKNTHQAETARGIQASIRLSDGSQVPLKNINQLSAEVLRLSPEGAVAKEIKWSIEHEADLVRGEQSWFWAGFFVGGFAFLAFSYFFAPQPVVYTTGPTYYYGVYRPWFW